MNMVNYAPWEHYPKTLRQHEIANPLSVIDDFFSVNSVGGHAKRLKEWRYYVVNDGHYKDKVHGPGTLLFYYDLNLRLLEALFLLLGEYKNFSYQWPVISETQLEAEKEQWGYYPKNLSLKEQLDPYKVINKAFRKFKPQDFRDQMHEWVQLALYNKVDTDVLDADDIITLYEELLKIYSAAWLICQRNSGQQAIIESTNNEQPMIESTSKPTILRNISPEPTPAEALALGEIKKLILKKCPSVELIMHLGTHPKPFTFYLLILIGDDEKIPEHEFRNKVEDNCKHLAHVQAIVHKTSSAKQSVENGKRFWSMVIDKGYTVYQSPELILPAHHVISKDVLLDKAHFSWNRWGAQGMDFLKGAENFIAEGNFRLASFLLHQSVESVLKAIIQAVIGYRVQMHNLERLLALSLLFTDDLNNIFDRSTSEGETLFVQLQNAYSHSRYSSSFNPDENQVRSIFSKASKFHHTAERVYKQFIADLTINSELIGQ